MKKSKELIRRDLANFIYDNIYTYTDIHWRTSTVLVRFGNHRASEFFYDFTEKEIKNYRKFYKQNFDILELYGLENL